GVEDEALVDGGRIFDDPRAVTEVEARTGTANPCEVQDLTRFRIGRCAGRGDGGRESLLGLSEGLLPGHLWAEIECHRAEGLPKELRSVPADGVGFRHQERLVGNLLLVVVRE